MSETIEVVNNEGAHRFEVRAEGETAFADYNLLRDAIVFTHTEVPQALEGRGIGGQIIRAGLQYAHDHGLKVKPICPFFAAYMTKHPETHDLAHKDFRKRLGIDPA